MKMPLSVFGRSLLLACAAVIAVGCSNEFDYGDTGRITGRLTMDGKALAPGHGVIFMEPLKGYLAYGETDENGEFTVNSWNNGNMPVGTYKVQIGGPPAPPPRTDMTAEERFDNPELAEPPPPPIVFPRKYLNKDSSGLQYEVKAGENRFEIDLQSKS